MAEDALGKTVKQLKRERTTAKSSFTRQANFISRGVSSMLEAELKEEFIKLSHCFRQLLDANDDYSIGLLAEGGATVVQEVNKSFSNQKVVSSIPCRSVLEQDTEPLIAPDVQCAISLNVKCVYIVSRTYESRFG